jgi:hypothetical protein
LADYALHDLLGRLGVSESDDPARRRLFDSPIEQLAAQIAKAVDDAVTEPSGERWLAIRTGVSDASTQAGLLYSATFLRVLGSLASADEETKLTVLVHQVASREYAQQQVDLLQISVGADWRRLISWLSVVISGVVGTTLALLVQPGQAVTASVICILVGGFLSWVIRDVAAGIEKWRTSP